MGPFPFHLRERANERATRPRFLSTLDTWPCAIPAPRSSENRNSRSARVVETKHDRRCASCGVIVCTLCDRRTWTFCSNRRQKSPHKLTVTVPSENRIKRTFAQSKVSSRCENLALTVGLFTRERRMTEHRCACAVRESETSDLTNVLFERSLRGIVGDLVNTRRQLVVQRFLFSAGDGHGERFRRGNSFHR